MRTSASNPNNIPPVSASAKIYARPKAWPKTADTLSVRMLRPSDVAGCPFLPSYLRSVATVPCDVVLWHHGS